MYIKKTIKLKGILDKSLKNKDVIIEINTDDIIEIANILREEIRRQKENETL